VNPFYVNRYFKIQPKIREEPEDLVLHIMLIIAHFAVGKQPDGNNSKNKQGNNDGKYWHG